jgi:hypothetical protein
MFSLTLKIHGASWQLGQNLRAQLGRVNPILSIREADTLDSAVTV